MLQKENYGRGEAAEMPNYNKCISSPAYQSLKIADHDITKNMRLNWNFVSICHFNVTILKYPSVVN